MRKLLLFLVAGLYSIVAVAQVSATLEDDSYDLDEGQEIEYPSDGSDSEREYPEDDSEDYPEGNEGDDMPEESPEVYE